MQVHLPSRTASDPAHSNTPESRHFFGDANKILTPACVKFNHVIRLPEEDHQFVHDATSKYNPSGSGMFSTWQASNPRGLLSIENTPLYTTI
jgi:hypothetical protein